MKPLIAGALLAPLFSLVCATAQAQNTILIGQSAPLSGANKDLGVDIRDGALAYFKKVNEAGGVNGRKIELETIDDGNVVKRAGDNTRKLIDENGVFALFGYASATLSRPALPFVEKSKVPFLGPFTGADPMRVYNRYVYNMRASYADELEKIVEHYTTFGIKRFAIVYYARSLNRYSDARFKLEIERNDLLELLDDRIGSRSTLITSQLPVKAWHTYLNDPTLADAILDRVVHSSHKIELKSTKSLRDIDAAAN